MKFRGENEVVDSGGNESLFFELRRKSKILMVLTQVGQVFKVDMV